MCGDFSADPRQTRRGRIALREPPLGLLASCTSPSSVQSRPASEQTHLQPSWIRLNQLHDDGLLTDDEFSAKRAEVIGRI